MSTRFYFNPNRRAAITTALHSGWEGNTGVGTNVSGRLVLEATGGPNALTKQQSQSTIMTANFDGVVQQFISDPLPAGTLSGTFSIVIPCGESTAGMDDILNVMIRVVDNTGTNVRGTAYAGTSSTTVVTTSGAINQEFINDQNNLTTRIMDSIALSSVTITSGDRLVVEVGYRGVSGNAGVGSDALMIFSDRADAIGDLALQADQVVSTTSFPPLRPWIEFSANITTTLTREQFRYQKGGLILNGDPPLPFVDIESVDGLDNTPYRTAQNDREGTDGGIVIASFESVRTVTLEGTIYASPSSLESYLDSLKENFAPTKKAYGLYFGTDIDTRVVYGKSLGLRYKKDSGRRLGKIPFQVQIVCADPRIYLGQSPTTIQLASGTNQVYNIGGNRETPLRILMRGVGTANNNFTINNSNGVFNFKYVSALPQDHILVINTDTRTVLLDYSSNVRFGATVTGTWSGFVPGNNTVVNSVGGKLDITYQEAYR